MTLLLCMNCRWIRFGAGDRCYSPNNIQPGTISPLDGKPFIKYQTALGARQPTGEGTCGPEARWFEPVPKPPVRPATKDLFGEVAGSAEEFGL